jgi:hypothetical protein
MRIVLAACGHTPVDAVEAGCVWAIATCCWTLRALPPRCMGKKPYRYLGHRRQRGVRAGNVVVSLLL